MSWVQWRGETLPGTQDTAWLQFTLRAPDMGGPQQNWNLDFVHEISWPDDGVQRKWRRHRWFTVELLEMGVQVRDVGDFSGMVIRSTPAWWAGVQESGEYGHLVEPVLNVHHGRVSEATGDFDIWEDYRSLEWELRFGRLDGMSLPFELDVWALIPEKEFHRMEPETEAELAKFAVGEPELRLMARVDITGGAVHLERCGDDPVPLARRRLREAVKGLEIAEEKLHWESNYVSMPDHKAVTEPGWRSNVRFETRR